MKKNFTYILVILAFIILAGGLMLLNYFDSRVAPNPPGTIGNTAGNLHNGGLFCEQDGIVYFTNPADNNALYSMTADEQHITKVYPGNVTNILVAGDYLYFFQKNPNASGNLGNLRITHAFYRTNLEGKDVVNMTSDVVITAQLVNDSLYMLTSTEAGPSFYKMSTDKSDKTILASYEVSPACAKDGYIYYNGTISNHYMYALNTETDIPSELWQGNIWYPVLEGDYFYFLDVDNNYRLCRYAYSQNMVEVLTQDRVDCFNIGNGYIYYQCNSQSAPALKMMRTDGSDVTVLAEGNYTAIHMTSKYVYFKAFGEEEIWYHSPIGSEIYSSM